MDSRNRVVSSLRDSDWVRKKHLLDSTGLDEETLRWRTYSTAHTKYTNASLGGNFPINQPPAFTRFADIRAAGTSIAGTRKYTNRHQRRMLGPGRYWSEALDDNRIDIHMRFGTPRYNGLATFFMNFYSHKAGLLAREGRASITYYAGLAVGSILALPVTGMIFIGKVASFLMGRPSNKYYHLAHNMPLYWNRVNFIVNQIQVKRQIAPQKLSGITDSRSPMNQEDYGVPDTDEYIKSASKNFPIFRDDGTIDVYNVARGAQALHNERVRQVENILMGATSREDIMNKMRTFISESSPSTSITGDIGDYLRRYHLSVVGDLEHVQEDKVMSDVLATPVSEVSADTAAVANDAASAVAADSQPIGGDATAVEASGEAKSTKPTDTTPGFFTHLLEDENGEPTWIGGFAKSLLDKSNKGVEYLEADLKEGGQFVTFAVEPGTVTESFSNSVTTSAIDERLNGMSKTAAIARFALSDGKTGVAPVDAIISGARNFVAGTLDGMHLSGLVALAGNAYVDIPKDYDSSSTQWPTSSYTLKLRAPYGNKYSQMMNLDFPLAMLLAAGLPISTGAASYTRPFLVEVYCRGRNQIRLGMIDQILVTRGTGNMGFNKFNQALGYDVTFSIADMSTVMHAPIDSTYGASGQAGPLSTVTGAASKLINTVTHFFDDENAFNDYLAVLSSMSVGDQIYFLRRVSIRLASARLDLSSYFSMSRWSSDWANGENVQMISGIFTPFNSRLM